MSKSGETGALKRLAFKAMGHAFGGRARRSALLRVPWLGPRYTILCYHRVADDGAGQYDPGLTVSPERLAQQLRFLRFHYEIVTVEALYRRLARKERAKRPLLALTFDDGDFSVWANAVPELERQGVLATFYVNSGALGGASLLWPDVVGGLVRRAPLGTMRAEFEEVLKCDARHPALEALEDQEPRRVVEALKQMDAPRVLALGQRLWERFSSDLPAQERPRYVSVEHVRQLHRKGFEIGGHTLHHPLLDRAPLELVRRQVEEDKGRLEAIVGRPLASFAYPNGNHNAAVRNVVAQVGYGCAVTVGCPAGWRRRLDPFALARCFIGPATGLDERGAFSEGLFFAELIGCLRALRRARGVLHK